MTNDVPEDWGAEDTPGEHPGDGNAERWDDEESNNPPTNTFTETSNWGPEEEEGPPNKTLKEREQEFKEKKFEYGIWIVAGAAFLLFAAGLAFYFEIPVAGECLVTSPPSAGATIFEAAKTILPPIATLVLGAYYSSHRN